MGEQVEERFTLDRIGPVLGRILPFRDSLSSQGFTLIGVKEFLVHSVSVDDWTL